MYTKTIILMGLVLFLYFYNTIKLNWITFLTLQRGIISNSCGWWSVSDLFTDTTGVNLFTKMKTDAQKNGKNVIESNLFGQKIVLPTDPTDIREILNRSPDSFGVGVTKQNFFNTFMKFNVGIAEPPFWLKARKLNELVLETGTNTHSNVRYISEVIESSFNQVVRNNSTVRFRNLEDLAERITSQLVFGEYNKELIQKLNRLFKKANGSLTTLFSTELNEKVRSLIRPYLKKPLAYSMIHKIQMQVSDLTEDEVLDQIPHWVFPIFGLVTKVLPRVLVLLYSFPEKKDLLINAKISLRHVFLETLRLNNLVSSTFRTVKGNEITLPSGTKLTKGTQLLIINNPLLRDPDQFPNPNEFRPERFSENSSLEFSNLALMFNQGPQSCPGKEISLLILALLTRHFLNTVQEVCPKVKGDVPQMINPCKVKFIT